MKLTWFGGTTMRVHIGGKMLVIDAEGAPAGIDRAELMSGADTAIKEFGMNLASVHPISWKPRRQPSVLLDQVGTEAIVKVWRIESVGILVDALGEPPLILTGQFEMPDFGHWAERAVFVILGSELKERAESLISAVAPRLIALAGDETDIDEAFEALEGRDYGVGLVSLETGLALEV